MSWLAAAVCLLDSSLPWGLSLDRFTTWQWLHSSVACEEMCCLDLLLSFELGRRSMLMRRELRVERLR
ncbi:hypothetical protein PMIT1342_00977 [Prochlorococcus marinus str. MIT 1342]|uniref:hypothetical protein n=1 Tax=Prochlorococcus TaxID=1218 RepID=UPI0007BB6361|nr:hypothetical protein [Prochlorococcus marinus]KZR82507.1 hypothetical protein PMIT1342_00977 [Prochlorococcus marinus str. MIT 1342]